MEKVRFRHSVSLVIAGVVAFCGALALATSRWYLAPVLLVPLVVTAWALRSGTDVDAVGLRVRGLLTSRHLSWSQIDGFAPQDGRVLVTLAGGRAVPLPAVAVADLPRLLRAGGQPSTLTPVPSEPDDDPDTDAPDPGSPDPSTPDPSAPDADGQRPDQ